MLPPHELKNKTFTRAMRGYNPVEVDEYIEFLIEKYTELYRENDELERKLKTTVTKLEEIKNDEDSIRSALIDAKRAAAQIKSEAEERAEAIIRSAKSSCNTILADFNEKIADGRSTLVELKRDTLDLKRELYERYSEHIRYIDKLTEGIDPDDIPDADSLRREAVKSLKDSIAEAYASPAPGTAEKEPEPEPTEPAPEPAPEPVPEPVPESEPAQPENFEDTVVFTPTAGDQPEATEDATVVFDTVHSELEASPDEPTLTVDREPLRSSKSGLKDSVKELNKRYKESGDVINTPDSDLDDDANYLDFVKSVTGKSEDDSKKDADFDLLFNDNNKKKKK